MVCKETQCEKCGKNFKPARKSQKCCSRKCNSGGRPKKYKYFGRNVNERRLNELKEVFNFESCMVLGCEYNNCYDIHRLVPGQKGGKYEIGNMFAICPNHHAEVHRGIIKLTKIDDCTLKME